MFSGMAGFSVNSSERWQGLLNNRILCFGHRHSGEETPLGFSRQTARQNLRVFERPSCRNYLFTVSSSSKAPEMAAQQEASGGK